MMKLLNRIAGIIAFLFIFVSWSTSAFAARSWYGVGEAALMQIQTSLLVEKPSQTSLLTSKLSAAALEPTLTPMLTPPEMMITTPMLAFLETLTPMPTTTLPPTPTTPAPTTTPSPEPTSTAVPTQPSEATATPPPTPAPTPKTKPATPKPPVKKPATFTIKPGVAQISFGSIYVGSKVMTKELVIKNFGKKTVKLGSVVLSGPSAKDFTRNTRQTRLSLKPGESTKIRISFFPKNMGTKSATLVIYSTDQKESVVVKLTAMAK